MTEPGLAGVEPARAECYAHEVRALRNSTAVTFTTYRVTVFAIVEASEADLPHLQAAVAELARHAVDEAGCMRYDVHVSIQAPTRMIIYEIWVNDAALELHRHSAHVAQFKRSLDGTTAKVWASQFEVLT